MKPQYPEAKLTPCRKQVESEWKKCVEARFSMGPPAFVYCLAGSFTFCLPLTWFFVRFRALYGLQVYYLITYRMILWVLASLGPAIVIL